jgi:hypothetical protein
MSTSNRLLRRLRILTLAGFGLQPCLAIAQAADPLAAAERAYREVDFETQRSEATRALEAGHHDRPTLAHIYRLLGVAHSALNSPELARQYFMKLLAIDRDVALEHVLSPRLRTPYMEARGFWDVTSARLDLELALRATPRELEITITDPLSMGARVRVTALGSPATRVAELDPAPRLLIGPQALAPHDGLPLQVEQLDPHANVIATRVLRPEPLAPSEQNSAAAASSPERAHDSPLPTLALALGGGALVALGVGVSAHIIRENKAREWNGSDCERPGQGTREQQCSNVDDQRRSAQGVARVAYATGGALLVASVVSYALSEDEREPAMRVGQVACGPGPFAIGLHCSTTW